MTSHTLLVVVLLVVVVVLTEAEVFRAEKECEMLDASQSDANFNFHFCQQKFRLKF